ncbi:lipase member N-like [Dermacentor albipictus]|uniref:lipase member N-like n=1 Tax=Dermacentor albipictus TaxID=60249 RepID=UPI0038FD2175
MRYFGNDVEVHKVTTEDGYILEVDRILPRSSGGATIMRTPMLLVHGLLGDAGSWVYRARKCVRFDYGILKNLVKYGQVKPPAYPLEQIRVPVAIYQGPGDKFAVPQDMDDLSERLKHVLVLKYMVPDPDFGHLDFIMGFNATDILHSHMIDLISHYTTVA